MSMKIKHSRITREHRGKIIRLDPDSIQVGTSVFQMAPSLSQNIRCHFAVRDRVVVEYYPDVMRVKALILTN